MQILFNSKTPEWAWLSNFSSHPVGTFPTAEHAYQASKFLDAKMHDIIRQAKTPADAKQIGKKTHTSRRTNWDAIKVRVMRRVLHAKFRPNASLRQRLMDTGTAELVHYAPWGDTFWGVDASGQGQNQQGILLMELRTQLNDEFVANACEW